MPISIPEAYEHFLGEDRSGGVLEQTALLQVQAMEPPSSVLWGVGTGTPPEPSPATAEQLNLAIRQAGVCAAGTPWPVQDSGTRCPGSSAKRAMGEGQARSLGCELVGPMGIIWARRTSSWPSGHRSGGAAQARQGFGSTLTVTLCLGPNNSSFCLQPSGAGAGAVPGQALSTLHLTFPPEGVL